ncbi:MAG: hypothetical protein AB7O59_01950 [Pirellulales bacterium]
MNMANSNYEEQDFEYGSTGGRAPEARRGGADKVSRKRSASYSRASRPAVSHNGIHRRRNKRFSW